MKRISYIPTSCPPHSVSCCYHPPPPHSCQLCLHIPWMCCFGSQRSQSLQFQHPLAAFVDRACPLPPQRADIHCIELYVLFFVVVHPHLCWHLPAHYFWIARALDVQMDDLGGSPVVPFHGDDSMVPHELHGVGVPQEVEDSLLVF